MCVCESFAVCERCVACARVCVKTLCATEVYVTELCAPVCDRVVCVTMLCDAKDRARHQRQPGAASATPATQEQHR